MTNQTWHTAHQKTLTRGQRAADALRNGMGSWPFIGTFILAMAVWATLNTLILRTGAFDPYPYILLNLFLSMLAGLQGAILLIAAKRQDGINSAMAQHDLDTNVASKVEIDRLIRLCEQHKTMISELHDLIQNRPGLTPTTHANPS
ncbi:hypothetical protein AX769_21300 (plasmid) [Frondihabitans sp. PAMC 28766]|uniref:DUF1003 domain-containing protein n=1 Tax=Frondihabitans sp. PAMC 28766 TaxID=1795630 RepID=UPI00078C9FDD|nr:DUF1003 domain-containing protein [Frondihabitans sp. PAMC 28766]AMM22672.1 hypothetical protein AX769_21300 [Frondihabitans sp. PAMC 28766]